MTQVSGKCVGSKSSDKNYTVKQAQYEASDRQMSPLLHRNIGRYGTPTDFDFVGRWVERNRADSTKSASDRSRSGSSHGVDRLYFHCL